MYKLLCIYEKVASSAYALRIEVTANSTTKSIAPFIRKVSVEDLKYSGISTGDSLLPLLEHSGVIDQPFDIDNRLLANKKVYELLQNYPLTYIQRGRSGSIRKGGCPLSFPLNSCNKVGELLGGELYISNLNNWNRDIRVRFRYKNTYSTFSTTFSSLPYIDNGGELFLRNENQENYWLHSLGDAYNSQRGTLSLPIERATETISRLCSLGWDVFVLKQDKKKMKLYVHREKTGIVWFSDGENTTNQDYTRQLLEGFLHGRNYSEWEGKLVLFKKQDIENLDDRSIVESLSLTLDLQKRYTNRISLSFVEKELIQKDIQKNICVPLYSYQVDGVLWLLEQRKNHCGCLLADDMGLGKTLQAIAYLACLKTSKQHLVIAPTSLIYNWKSEVLKFAPQLIRQISFVSYDMLRIHIEEYMSIDYDTIIIDEAQIIKNRETKKYAAVRCLKSQQRIILSGTPIENSIEEVWNHFIQLMPDMKFIYDKLHKMGFSSNRELYTSLTAHLLKPFILRRTKEEVLVELPKCTEKIVYVELSEAERIVYHNLYSVVLQSLQTGYTGRINSLVLEGLLRLRQTCVSPNLLPISLRNTQSLISSKFKVALDYILQLRAESRKVLVFSQFVRALEEMEQLLEINDVTYVSLYGNTCNRGQVVSDFQQNESIGVFLISLKAGGTGLNLTQADCVLLLDDWWNPAVEAQAIGRAHRIGQTHNVLVIRLVCRDTIEEKILALQERKRKTIETFNDIQDTITQEELIELLS